MNDFPIEKQSFFESILPTVNNFKIEVYPLKHFLCFINYVILSLLLLFKTTLLGTFFRMCIFLQINLEVELLGHGICEFALGTVQPFSEDLWILIVSSTWLCHAS